METQTYDVGDVIEAGDEICIIGVIRELNIEAMNRDGKYVDGVLVENHDGMTFEIVVDEIHRNLGPAKDLTVETLMELREVYGVSLTDLK